MGDLVERHSATPAISSIAARLTSPLVASATQRSRRRTAARSRRRQACKRPTQDQAAATTAVGTAVRKKPKIAQRDTIDTPRASHRGVITISQGIPAAITEMVTAAIATRVMSRAAAACDPLRGAGASSPVPVPLSFIGRDSHDKGGRPGTGTAGISGNRTTPARTNPVASRSLFHRADRKWVRLSSLTPIGPVRNRQPTESGWRARPTPIGTDGVRLESLTYDPFSLDPGPTSCPFIPSPMRAGLIQSQCLQSVTAASCVCPRHAVDWTPDRIGPGTQAPGTSRIVNVSTRCLTASYC